MLLLHKLNEELKRQGLPKITEEVHHWRMAHVIGGEFKKKSSQNASAQQRGTGRNTGSSVPESSDVSNAANTSHYDLNESDATQRLAKQAVNMVDAQTRLTSNTLSDENHAMDPSPYYNLQYQPQD